MNKRTTSRTSTADGPKGGSVVSRCRPLWDWTWMTTARSASRHAEAKSRGESRRYPWAALEALGKFSVVAAAASGRGRVFLTP